MRLIVSLLLTLLLAACASTAPTTGASNSTPEAQSKAPLASTAKGKQRVSSDQTIDLDNDSLGDLAYGSDDADLWSRIRHGFAIPDLDTDLAQDRTQWYAQRPEYVERMIQRSNKYLFHIVEELERRHMPTELALLPFVESAYNPQALSTAKAAGMWQFIPSTGKTYNLKQNMFQDERRDVLASTTAALDYLSKLYAMFGDWHLALAAYNWGEGNVQRAIDRNQAQGLPTDYLSLRMPTETRYYVPKLQAIKNIIAHPDLYSVKLPEIPNHPYFVSVTTKRDIDVALAAKLADLPLDEFRALNPSFRKPVILGAAQPQILLPFDSAEVFQRRLKGYDKPLSSWTTYTSSSRERPEDVALKLGVDAAVIRSVNNIAPRMRLKAGSTLLVPRSDDIDQDISASVASNAVLALEPDLPDTRKVMVRARKHDTLASVASRSGVSVAQIKSWNRLRRDTLTSGQLLVLHVPVKDASRVMAASAAPAADAAPAAKNDDDAPRTRMVRGKNGKMIRVVDRRPTASPAKAAVASSKTTAPAKVASKAPAKAPAKTVAKTAAKPAAKAPAKVTKTAQR
ncbi:transglycosylase SLT domain-containing protein [Pandoraea apista]|uniref:transglycosylase SLT domain-containing protein n=1 Tax=Pandoraea apista TaxID=93218 RepID=UPI00058A8B5B|nr:transglycosylase SLT domain-containing protein [Pandoraea apista]AJE97045.1 lytic transglycosylase [Pandoraea apista]AKH70994.1 lytic transglycosylase [Pandoraea apista]AKI63266.1 lytic transglycosylase [Pandoraea apista]